MSGLWSPDGDGRHVYVNGAADLTRGGGRPGDFLAFSRGPANGKGLRGSRLALRPAALTCAVEDETIAHNPVKGRQMTKRRTPRHRRKPQAWTVDDAMVP